MVYSRTREESARTFIALSLIININSRNGIDFLFCKKVNFRSTFLKDFKCLYYEGYIDCKFVSFDTSGIGYVRFSNYLPQEKVYEYFEYSLFISEIVSKVNEILLNEYILSEETEQEEKIYLLNDVVSSLINTLFGQPMFTEIEDELMKSCDMYRNLYEIEQ